MAPVQWIDVEGDPTKCTMKKEPAVPLAVSDDTAAEATAEYRPNTSFDEELVGARVSVQWEVADHCEWFEGTVVVRFDAAASRCGAYQIEYDCDHKRHWSLLNQMELGEVGGDAEWAVLQMQDVGRGVGSGSEGGRGLGSVEAARGDEDAGTSRGDAETVGQEMDVECEGICNEGEDRVRAAGGRPEHAGAGGRVGTEAPFDLSPWRSSQNASGYKGVTRHGLGYKAQISTGDTEHGPTWLVALWMCDLCGDRAWSHMQTLMHCEIMPGHGHPLMGYVAGGTIQYIGSFGTAEAAAEAYAKEFLLLHYTAPALVATLAAANPTGGAADESVRVYRDVEAARGDAGAGRGDAEVVGNGLGAGCEDMCNEGGDAMRAATGRSEHTGVARCAGTEASFDLSPWTSSQNTTGYKGVSRDGCGYSARISTGEIEIEPGFACLISM